MKTMQYEQELPQCLSKRTVDGQTDHHSLCTPLVSGTFAASSSLL